MISPLYFKPSKRSAGGDLMISFVMEKCLVLPMCVCVQNTKKALCFMSNRSAQSHSNNTCQEGCTKTNTYSYIFFLDCNYTQMKGRFYYKLQHFILQCAAMPQRGDVFIYQYGISPTFFCCLSFAGQDFASLSSFLKTKNAFYILI